MRALWDKAEKLTKGIENKALKIVAFYTALAGLFAIIPGLFAFIYGTYIFGNNLYNLNGYIEYQVDLNNYLVHQIGQNTRKVDAEHDLKYSFGVPLRMSNPPKINGKPTGQGDLWYTSYTKIGDLWYIVTYKASPNMSEGSVDIFNYYKEWEKAGEEIKPTKEDIKAN